MKKRKIDEPLPSLKEIQNWIYQEILCNVKISSYAKAYVRGKSIEVFEDEKLVMTKSYYDESYFKMPVHDGEVIICNRKISTYINALAKAGFVVEQLVEESDNKSLNATEEADPKTKKAKMLPISFCIKARKL